MEAFERNCCIHGYHIHKEIWQAAIGKELKCDRELDNSCDRHSEESTWQLELLQYLSTVYCTGTRTVPNVHAYSHTRTCVTRRARSIGRTNVRSSNYSPWNIFTSFNFELSELSENIFRLKIFQTTVHC